MTEATVAPSGLPRPPQRASRRKACWFLLIYLRRELRQAVMIALWLAVGVALVMMIAAITAGVGNAQAAALRSLYGIGTDLTVTALAEAPADPRAPTPDSPGTLLAGNLGLLRASSVTDISRLRGVARATGGLNLTEIGRDGNATPAIVPVDGVDIGNPGAGPFVAGALTSGRSFAVSETAADVAVVDSRYAAANHLAAGSAIAVGGTAFHVIGIIGQAPGGNGADVYIPLTRAQALTRYQGLRHLTGWVNVIYVTATSAAKVTAVHDEIARLLPSATLASSADLASAINGSLASAANLADDLGRWTSASALIASCGITSLLTLAAVNRRTREIGTLKALGWRGRAIVVQIMSESLVTGVIGALIGVAIGFAGVAVVNAAAPVLTASAPSGSSGPRSGAGSPPAVTVHLTAQLSVAVIAVTVGLCLSAALIAGAFGARRAARFQPADAFAQLT